MQSCIERAVALCKRHRLFSGADPATSCVMDKESRPQEVENARTEPPRKKTRYSRPSCDALGNCEATASPGAGYPVESSSMPAMTMEDVVHPEFAEHTERFTSTGTSNIPTCAKDSDLLFVPRASSHTKSEPGSRPIRQSKPRAMEVNHVHASDSSILEANMGTEDEVSDDDDDASDASKLVLSVIKTKLNIQTMKMCLQHNAETSFRPVSVNAGASFAGTSAGAIPELPQHLLDSPFVLEDSSSRPSRRDAAVDDAEFRQAELEAVDRGRENVCHCNASSCRACCRREGSRCPDPTSTCTRASVHLAHWQDQHTAKAIVDNAINRTIEEMVIAPDQANPAPASECQVNGIRGHGIGAESQQSVHILQQRLQPVINQLTEASELVFARNIAQSRDEFAGRPNNMPSTSRTEIP